MYKEFEKIARAEAGREVFAYETIQSLRLLSRKKSKAPSILVLGRYGFNDNSKYLFLALAARTLGFPVFWGTFNPKLYEELSRRNLPVLDLRGDPAAVVSLLLEISCVVYCTNPAEATGHPFYRAALAGARKVQLWHGIGLKTIDLQLTAGANLLDEGMLRQLEAATDIDEVLSPSSLYDNQWREAFGVERILRAGFPRNEVLVRPATEHELIDAPEIEPGFKERGFVMYAPTFTYRGAEPAWADPRLLDLLEAFAQYIGVGLVIKPHPFDRDPTPVDMARLSPSTLLLKSESDVYPVLQHASAMITDASSMVSDFLLCDRPVFFFRSAVIEKGDYPKQCMPELPGQHIREESITAFKSAWDSAQDVAMARRRLCQRYFETDPRCANESIIKRLVEIVSNDS